MEVAFVWMRGVPSCLNNNNNNNNNNNQKVEFDRPGERSPE